MHLKPNTDNSRAMAGAQAMSDEDRLKLAEKLDRELEEFIGGLERRKYTEGWPEDRWEEEMEKHPFFMKKPPEPGEELSPLMEGLQQLKYDPAENTPAELATAYKDDGNFNFKYKKYRLAILCYTEGIRTKCEDATVMASLLNNRAAAHFELGNHRSSLSDCERALKLKPSYAKVLIRAAKCCLAVQQYKQCQDYCDQIFALKPADKAAADIKNSAIHLQKFKERDERKSQAAESRRSRFAENLVECIRKRGCKLEEAPAEGGDWERLRPQVPQLADCMVHLEEETNSLVWPVVFLYPEYKTMDFVQNFNENSSLEDQLTEILAETPNLQSDPKYSLDNVSIYFENRKARTLHAVQPDSSLGQVLARKEYTISCGTPTFMVFAKGSPAEAHYLQRK